MILQAKHLTKRYGNHMAVDDIQLEFERGSFNAIFWDPMVEINHYFHVNRFEKSDTRSDSICAKYENRSGFSS